MNHDILTGRALNKKDVLKTLASTMDVDKTMSIHKGLSEQDFKDIINEASGFFADKKTDDVVQELIIHCDGASRGNPGKAGAGFVFNDSNSGLILEKYSYLGIMTNNVAEYRALILALSEALKLGVKKIKVFSDSQLLVRQINGEYKVRDKGLCKLYHDAVKLLKNFENYDIIHIPRKDNESADRLANRAIDESAC